MGTISKKVTVEGEEIVDDLPKGDIEVTENDLDEDKLAALKAKLANKNEEKEDMPPRIVEEPKRSIELGIIGSGQCGSRLAESFYDMGYTAVAVNTARQDLEHINIPDSNKLLLEGTLGGAAKNLELGHDVAEANRDGINALVKDKLSNAQVLIFCTSLGGGSGAGSSEVILDILSTMDVPVVVITVLPMDAEDAQVKHNALQTLSKMASATQKYHVATLICVDNAKIETVFADVGQLDFYKIANSAITEPINAFNYYSALPSPLKGLDSMEWGTLFTDGNGLACYGTMTVANYEEDTAIAEAIVSDLGSNMLATGFDLKKAKYVGAIIIANKKVWDKIPSSSINYATTMLNDVCASPKSVFKGVYIDDDMQDDVVKVYSMFTGLSLPESRVDQLKKEAQEEMQKSVAKDEERNLSLKVDTGIESTVNAAQALKDRIARKKSNVAKLNKTIIDRRKK